VHEDCTLLIGYQATFVQHDAQSKSSTNIYYISHQCCPGTEPPPRASRRLIIAFAGDHSTFHERILQTATSPSSHCTKSVDLGLTCANDIRMGHYSLDHLHIRYCDFAYKPNGPFRMANTNIGDATAKTFAE